MLEITQDAESRAELAHMSAMLAEYPLAAERAIGSSLRSEGYRLRMEMKEAIARGGVATHRWPGINPQAKWMTAVRRRGWVKNWRTVTRGKRKKWRGKEYWSERFRRTVSQGMTRQLKTGTPLAKFKGGLRYNYDKATTTMQVGFVNPSTPFQKILERHATGFATPISAKARRFAFAMGLPISKYKRFFHIPARPLVGPVWEKEKAHSLRNIEEKFMEMIAREISRGRTLS